jgi:hypothetical protein
LKSGEQPETKAAKCLTNTYLEPLSQNWYYMVARKFEFCVCITQLRKNLQYFVVVFIIVGFFSGIPGIYPTLNFCEDYQLNIKGSSQMKGVLQMNQLKLTFIKSTLSKLLTWEW